MYQIPIFIEVHTLHDGWPTLLNVTTITTIQPLSKEEGSGCRIWILQENGGDEDANIECRETYEELRGCVLPNESL